MNESQKKAVTHTSEGNLLVVAGPGSGKTLVITQRIFYLIQELHVRPETILVVTFTKDAALSMQNRFLEQSDVSYPVNFGTFHSIFYNIYRQSINNRQGNIKLANDKDKKNLLKTVIYSNNIQFDDEILQSLLAAFSFYKNTFDMEAAKEHVNEAFRPHFEEIFSKYEAYRKERKIIDFDDMVYDCHKLLSDKESLRKSWQERFTHILIDEFQDINPVQISALRLLKGENTSFFAVGDDDQSIYGFRGAKPACMKAFLEEYKAEEVHLDINYRSTPDIVKASLSVITENKNRFVKDLHSVMNNTPDSVKLTSKTDRETEYEYLKNELLKYEKGGITGQTLGVLFRTNILMQGFAAHLNAENIPFVMKEKYKSIYDNYIVRDVWSYMELAYDMNNRSALLNIMNKPQRYLNRESVLSERADIWDSMKYYYVNQDNIPYRRERLMALDKLRKNIEYISMRPPYLAVQYILKSVGLYDFFVSQALYTEKKREVEETVEWLLFEAKKHDSFKEWNMAREAYNECVNNRDTSKDRVNSDIYLMTVHGSKGLEFDRVWIPDCNENVFPHGRMPKEDVCEEERRIFYVAMTRAKKSLELLYLTGTKERPRQPSRFLNPLLKA
jgi:DNA helicase-2/ATP-dependent DNA helicase PcrA